jgi:Family of unknown function (DUF6739)
MRNIFEPKTLFVLAGSLGGVWTIGLYEGALLVTDAWTHWWHVLHYSVSNIVPSMVLHSQDIALLVSASGESIVDIVRVFDPQVEQDALDLVRINALRDYRSILASFMAISQLLRIVGIGLQSSNGYRDSILAGTEPPINAGNKQRVIRLAGRESDTTQLSMIRYGSHLLPVFEQPENVKKLVKRHWQHGRMPVFWHVNKTEYGFSQAWDRIDMTQDWLIRTKKGEEVLYIEADATNVEEALALGKPSTDLSLDSAAQAFRAIELVARTQALPFDKVVRVFLADSLQEIRTGGGNTYTLRQQVDEMREVDVLIDSLAPLLSEVLVFCERAANQFRADLISEPQNLDAKSAEKESRKLVFHTANAEYFHVVKQILGAYGYVVLDRGDKDLFDPYQTPRLVYEKNTAETVSTVHALLGRGLINPARCCVLIDNPAGVKELNRLAERFRKVSSSEPVSYYDELPAETVPGDQDGSDSDIEAGKVGRANVMIDHSGSQCHVHVLCSSEIYDDLLRQVRTWVRMGFSSKEVSR